MKIRLDEVHSPCKMCFLKGIFYDPDSIYCQRCEYNIVIKLLKRVLKENDFFIQTSLSTLAKRMILL